MTAMPAGPRSAVTKHSGTAPTGVVRDMTDQGGAHTEHPADASVTQEAADRVLAPLRLTPRVFPDACGLNMHLDRKHQRVVCIKGRQKDE